MTDGSNQDETQTVFNNRVRLNFETSFTGKDLLRTRLQAGNFNNTFNQNGPTVTNMTRLAYDDGRDNDITIDDLFYRAPIGTPFGNITVWVGANALNLDDVFITANPFLADSGTGALSRGQRYNNIVFRGPSGVGAGVRFNIGDVFQVTGTYLAEGGVNGASNPNEGSGLFNGSYSTGAQVGFSFIKFADINFVYVHSYQTAASMSSGLFGNVSSPLTERPFGNVGTTANRFGLQASAQVIPGVLNLAGWAGYADASATGVNDAIGDNNTGIWSWNLNLSVLDLFAEGAALSRTLADPRITALCLGPALGRGAREVGLVSAALGAGRATVLDADALTLVAQFPALRAALHPRCVLTPHDGEFARLFAQIAARRAGPVNAGTPAFSKVDAARQAAKDAGCVVLLKGADTVIAAPDGRCCVHASVRDRASPWLATAGSGDVLAGLIAGLLARGFSPFMAAETAVWLHAEAALLFGPGLIAEDLPDLLPPVLRRLLEQRSPAALAALPTDIGPFL